MKLLRHPAVGLVVFAVLVSLIVMSYNGIKTGYGLPDEYTKNINGTDMNIMDAMNNIGIIKGLNETTSSIYGLSTPSGSSIDILGALASASIGAINTVIGLLTFPFEIGALVLRYYDVPPIIITGLMLALVLYVGFILLSAYLKQEV